LLRKLRLSLFVIHRHLPIRLDVNYAAYEASLNDASSSSSGHNVEPVNDLFQPHDFIRLVVS